MSAENSQKSSRRPVNVAWMLFAVLILAAPLAASQTAPNLPMEPIAIPVSNHGATPPTGIEDAVPWAMVMFFGSEAVTVKPLELAETETIELPNVDELRRDVIRAFNDNTKIVKVNIKEGDPGGSSVDSDDEWDRLSAFDLHISDWPGVQTNDRIVLKIQEPSIKGTKMMPMEITSFEWDGVIFANVPILTSATYTLEVGSARYAISPFTEKAGVPDPFEPITIPVANPCPNYNTPLWRYWDNYEQDWLGRNTSDVLFNEWGDLSQSAWKYRWSYQDPCDPTDSTDVYAEFGFGWTGLSKLPEGGTYVNNFGAQWWGANDVDCYRIGGYRHQVCEGHRVILGKTHFTYRTPEAAGAAHVGAGFYGFPSASCYPVMTPAMSAALTTVAFQFPWVGLAGYVPDRYCKINSKESYADPNGNPGLGSKLVEKGVSDGSLKQVAGYVMTTYPAKTQAPFKMDLVGAISYNTWVNGCAGPCKAHTQAGTHYSLTQPMAQVIGDSGA